MRTGSSRSAESCRSPRRPPTGVRLAEEPEETALAVKRDEEFRVKIRQRVWDENHGVYGADKVHE